ncbi:hypothetical protein [Candidatus Electrothrix sp.]|uniref:hypothetical protein n=1 Tax=Candidatus Electrothrix sp. TaxID=2170559 RepID=UPI00405774DC
MKRSFFVVYPFLALCLVLSLFAVYFEKGIQPSGRNTQEDAQLIYWQKIFSTGEDLLNTGIVRRLIRNDQSTVSRVIAQGIAQQLHLHSRSLRPQQLIPHHAMLVLELPDAAATGKSFLDSRFGQTLNAINWPAVLQRLTIKSALRRSLEQNTSCLMEVLGHPLFGQLFNRPLFIAQLSSFSSFIQEKKQSQPLLEDLLIVMDVGQDNPEPILAALLEIFQGRQTAQNIAGMTVYVVQLQKRQKIYLTAMGGNIVLSFAQQRIQESIALFFGHFLDQRKDLLLNQEYIRVEKERPAQTDLFLYADLFRLKLHFKALLVRSGSKKKSQQYNYSWAPGVRAMGFYHHSKEDIDHLQTRVHFSQDQLYPFQQHIYSTLPSLSHSFQEVPDDLLLSLWFNWLEPRLWWQNTLAHGEKDDLASADRIAAWIKAKTDMSMDQFLGVFGKNFSVHIAGISTAGFFPVPRLCLSIEILNRKKVDAFFQKIIGDLPVKRTMVGGVPVVSLFAAQGMLQPSYAFFNGYLLLADSREQIRDILLRPKAPLAEGDEYQAVDTRLDVPANLHFFARTPEMITALQELASWAGTMIAVRDHKAGATSKLLIDQVISPVLESLKVYKAIGIRSNTGPGELVIDGTVLRATPKK